MFRRMPGSFPVYTPGIATSGPGVPLPPPVTLICPQEICKGQKVLSKARKSGWG